MPDVQVSLEQLDSLELSDLEELYEAVTEFDDIPVDISTFLDGSNYLGSFFEGSLFAYWRKALKEIYPSIHYSPYWLIAFKGGIGGGKTTAACAGMLYDLHKLLCHKNPQKVLGGIPSDKIDFAIFNVTLTLAADVVWDKISQMFSSSEYFKKMMEVSKKRRKDETLFPKRIDFFSGSRVGHSLGRSIFSVLIDEANFEVVTGQIRKSFYSLLRRMSSRFMEIGGGFPGKIWIVSSETDKSSVLNSLIEEYRNAPGVYICQPALWDVKPEKYRGKKLQVYKGSDLRPPIIIDETNVKQYEDESENIIEVPEEHRMDFESSINDALRDLAGVSTGSRYKLFKLKEKMTQALCVNLLFPEVMELEFYDESDQIHNKTLIPNYFNGIAYPHYPRYIHIDIGLSGDRLGLACSYVSQYKEIQRRDITTFDIMVEAVPELVVEFAFAIQAKPGQQIPLFKVRSFILWLVSKGYTLGMISADGYECFTGDTKISLLNGTEVEIKDLVGRDEFWVYSCTPEGKVVSGRGHSARKIGVRQTIKVTLDNGEVIKCTADHRFMLRDGTYKEAQYLTSKDSLMPLYRKIDESGYERFIDNGTSRWNLTHIRVAKSIDPDFKPCRYEQKGNKVHHEDLNKRNNTPENLIICESQEEHKKYHIYIPGSGWTAVWKSEGFRERKSKSTSEQMKKQWAEGKFEHVRDNLKPWNIIFQEHPEVLDKIRERGKKMCTDYSTHPRVLRWLTEDKVIDVYKKLGSVIKTSEFFGVSKDAINIRLKNFRSSYEYTGYSSVVKGGISAVKNLNSNLDVYWNRCYKNSMRYGCNEEEARKRADELTENRRFHNHKIVSIELCGSEDVYDIEVDEYHNFALSSGVFVHNSADSLQLLRRLGFDTSEISVDKTPLPYMKLRSMVYEDLIFMPMSKLLRTELEELEVTPDGAKIDHPMKGSKDVADGVCGSVISTIRNSDKHKMMYITMAKSHSISSEVKQLFWPEMEESEV